jgi:hypothetical protein
VQSCATGEIPRRIIREREKEDRKTLGAAVVGLHVNLFIGRDKTVLESK